MKVLLQKIHKDKFIFIWMFCLFFLLFMLSSSSSWSKRPKTPDYYEYNVRSLFKDGEWYEGKKLLDEGMKNYSETTGLNELMGMYYENRKDYDKARFFLIKSINYDNSNVRSKQMLVKVEEETKNYSSAICYVNELLEVNPYWKGLWMKKINLFRQQGNDIEADRLLARLYQIYPNDKSLKRTYLNRMEEIYEKDKKGSDLTKAVDHMKTMLNVDQDNASYYNELCNLLIQQGEKEEALSVANRGIFKFHGDMQLIRKKTGLLAEEHRYPEAIAFLKECSKKYPSGEITRLENGLEEESAYDALRNDPYVQFGKIYEKQHSNEALTYLLNTSMSREYNEDALYYIGEAKKRRRSDPKLMYKEAVVYKRMGNTKKSIQILEKIHLLQPKNSEVIEELCQYHLGQAADLMISKQYSEALPHLNFIITNGQETEYLPSALNKKYVCLTEDGKYNLAMNFVDSLLTSGKNGDSWTVRKAFLLAKTGQVESGLNILKEMAMREKANISTENSYHHYAEDYEEMAIPYIKSLIARGAILKAFEASNSLLEVYPNSQLGLLYAMNTSKMLGKTKDFEKNIEVALQYYPNDVLFIVKQAGVYNSRKEYKRSIEMLRPCLDSLMGDTILIGAYSESCDLQAMQYLKNHEKEAALNVIDSALVFDSSNRMLLYDKGLVYEALGRYDSAHFYEKYYQPSLMDVSEFKRHLMDLEYKTHSNEISVDYLHSRFGENDVIKGLSSISYTRRLMKNTYKGSLNYSGRDGYVDGTSEDSYSEGGTGVQIVGEWEHKFSPLWSGSCSLGWSNRFFPTWQAAFKVQRSLKNDWSVDVHAGYRRVESNWRYYRLDSTLVSGSTNYEYSWAFDRWETSHKNLFNIGVGIGKDLWPFSLTGKIDALALSGNLYFTSSVQAKYFPLEDHITSLVGQAGIGTAPEASILDKGLPGSFNRLNTMVGLGGNLMLTSHLSAMLMGTWYTFYNETNIIKGNAKEYREETSMRYKNMFNLYVQFNISF